MIDLIVMTSTPAVLRTRLIAQGILKDDPRGGLVGVFRGCEFTQQGVPNPIISALAVGTFGRPGYVPPVMDPRKVYQIRLAQEADADDDDGSATQPNDTDPRGSRSKFVKWVKANGVREDIASADGVVFKTWRVGATLWLLMPNERTPQWL